MIYRGQVIAGGGYAQKTLPIQFRSFVWFNSILKDAVPATINVRLEKPFRPDFKTFDHIQTRQFKWVDNFPPEHFKFYPVEMAYESQGQNKRTAGFIYESSLSGHRLQKGYVIEVVAPPLSISTGARVELMLTEGVPGKWVNRGITSVWTKLIDRLCGTRSV